MTRLEPSCGCSVGAWLVCVLASSCHPANAAFPWAAPVERVAAGHEHVRTLNQGYQRRRSHVLVRAIDRPTRATLDYAAYHANFMIADPAPENLGPAAAVPRADNPFSGLLDRVTLTGDVANTPLTLAERRQPLAFAPLVEFLLASKVVGADALEELGSAVRRESWGQPVTPGVSSQAIAEVFLHRRAPSGPELWVKVEFAPWFRALGELPDQDGDGFPEIYGRARADRLTAEVVAFVEREYSGKVLGPAEVKAWANQLASYWYPSFNTDLAAPDARWPDEHTEADIARELAGQVFSAPTIVLRGKPSGQATYNVFLVGAAAGAAQPKQATAPGTDEAAALVLAKTRPTPNARATVEAIARELAERGQGSWKHWAASLAPFHAAVRRRLAASPPQVKALAGADGFLFFRNSLEYVVGGDLEQQPPGKNPLPIIVEFKKELEALGVDFLFVPVPAKVEVFPDRLDPKFKGLVGQIVNPFSRKFLLGLAEQGVEVVDLLPSFLGARGAGDPPGQEPLYQPQDTHWTDRGLRLAADLLAARIKQYPWYAELARHAQRFEMRETNFTRFGDLHSRLPESLQREYRPETLIAHQVLRADGAPYEDMAESPIVVLGDSFTGVYELTDAEHAGLSAHLARGVSYPVDLVMSYGGGPNVRNKLMRRGTAALAQKKLVIWVMAARDLYRYWENWEPLKK
jgi:alginate O-acetyltransferase complex protein AlgJ